MILEKIITLANSKVRLQFLAMERSLRATGCNLPIWVIPYDDDLFDLPNGSEWWVMPEIIDWLNKENAHPMMRKYQCFTVENYQYVDSDVCFLRNPEEVLKPFIGFITSCGHWRDTTHTCNEESLKIIKKKSTTWQYRVFNAGQFACDSSLYNADFLIETAMKPDFINTCVKWKFNDQPGMNLLVILSDIEISNLTLPPSRMESTWAGDYINGYDKFWIDESRKPYLIHWAGYKPGASENKIDKIFFEYLTDNEIILWKKYLNMIENKKTLRNRYDRVVSKIYRSLPILFS